jgi:hypothetical protein
MLLAIPRDALVTVADIEAASVAPRVCMIENIRDSSSTRRGLGGDKDEKLDTVCSDGFDDKWRSKANIFLVLEFKPRTASRPWYRASSIVPTASDLTCWTAESDLDFCSPGEGANFGVVFVAVDMCKSALIYPSITMSSLSIDYIKRPYHLQHDYSMQ